MNRVTIPHPVRFLLVVIVGVLFAHRNVVIAQGAAADPRVQVRMTQPPYYVHDRIAIEIRIDGLTGDAEPTAKLTRDPVDGFQVEFQGATPNRQESMEILNGVVRRSSSTVWVLVFQVHGDRPGEFVVGPFEVRQGQTKVTTEEYKIELKEIPRDDSMMIAFEVPNRRLFVGERIPATLVWGIEGPTDRLAELTIQLDQPKSTAVRPKVDTVAQQHDVLPVWIGNSNQVKCPVTRVEETRAGKKMHVFRGEFELTVDAPGPIDFSRPIAIATKVISGSRDPIERIFGGGQMRTMRIRAEGEPVHREVEVLPTANRPPSFAGAIGQGFAIDVKALRTVVQVGEPMSLEIILRGPSIATLRLPDLTKASEFPSDRFQISESDLTGDVDLEAGTKTFRLTARVKVANVQELPGVSYSWFDPTRAEYVTIQSQPVALRVQSSEVVSAASVESNRVPVQGPQSTPAVSDGRSDQVTDPERVSYGSRLKGADLSYVSDPSLLSRSSRIVPSSAIYCAGVLLAAWATLGRGWGHALQTRRKEGSTNHAIRDSLAKASDMPADAAARHLVRVLMQLHVSDSSSNLEAYKNLIVELEKLAFNPQRTSAALDPELFRRVQQLVQAIAKDGSC
ncbi:MAG: BatD family protein [Planctomycetota bacterium]|nr:BatD family protein [Planctomycetota bacterium]